jgi:hypothetical protein
VVHFQAMAKNNTPSGAEPPLQITMTLDEFIKRARDRGIQLRTERNKVGRLILTDGEKRYALSLLAPSLLTESLIGDLLYHFCDEDNVDLLLAEFHFDPTVDD